MRKNQQTFQNSIDILSDLIKIESSFFHEDAIVKHVSKWLNENGISNHIMKYHEKKITGFKGKNIICIVEGGKEGPVLLLNGHLDTVKLCSGWKHDPFGAIIEDGNIYGVGALDMKGGCAAILSALKEFHDNHKEFNGRIITTLVSGEEGPYGLGTDAVIESGITDEVDISIVTEPSAGFTNVKFPNICLGARGGYGLTVEFYGLSAHASKPAEGINAAIDAGRMITHLDNIKFKEDKLLGKGNICVLGIESDGGACSVPDYAEVHLFRHTIPGETKESIADEINEIIKMAGIKCKYNIRFREAPSHDTEAFLPYTVCEDNEYVKTLKKSCKDITDQEASVTYFHSIGDFNYLGTRIDAPCLIIGPAGGNYHSAEEYATIDSVIKTAEILYNFMEKLLIQ